MSYEVQFPIPEQTEISIDVEQVIRAALDDGAELGDLCRDLSWEEKALAVKEWCLSRHFIEELVNECRDDGLQSALAQIFNRTNEDFIREVLNKADTDVVPDFPLFRRGQVWMTDNPGLLAKITDVDFTDDSALFTLVLADENNPIKVHGLSVDEVNELPTSQRWMAKHQVTSEFRKEHPDYDDLDYFWSNAVTGLVLTGLLTDPEYPVAGVATPAAPTPHESYLGVIDDLDQLQPDELVKLVRRASIEISKRVGKLAKRLEAAEQAAPPVPFDPRGKVAVLYSWSQSPTGLTLGKAYHVGFDRRFKDNSGDFRDSIFGDWEPTFLAEEILERSKAGDLVRCVCAPETGTWIKKGVVYPVVNLNDGLYIQEPESSTSRPLGRASSSHPDVRFVWEAA